MSQDPAATSYLLVETRFDGTAERFLADAATLVHTGGRVRLFLAADAVALGIRGERGAARVPRRRWAGLDRRVHSRPPDPARRTARGGRDVRRYG